MMYQACRTPGSQARRVRRMLIRRSMENPVLTTTANGGKKSAMSARPVPSWMMSVCLDL